MVSTLIWVGMDTTVEIEHRAAAPERGRPNVAQFAPVVQTERSQARKAILANYIPQMHAAGLLPEKEKKQ